MTTLSRSADAIAAQSGHAVRYLTAALIALLVATVLVLALALASADGGSGDRTGSIRVAPSAQPAPLPPSAAERNQPGGLNGPGMRP
jgi:hypothetical protein